MYCGKFRKKMVHKKVHLQITRKFTCISKKSSLVKPQRFVDEIMKKYSNENRNTLILYGELKLSHMEVSVL